MPFGGAWVRRGEGWGGFPRKGFEGIFSDDKNDSYVDWNVDYKWVFLSKLIEFYI